ncbi:MAG: TonB-dependent receptor plug domain-containing protein [bacterium]
MIVRGAPSIGSSRRVMAGFLAAALFVLAARASAATSTPAPADTSVAIVLDPIDVPGRGSAFDAVVVPFARTELAADRFGPAAGRDVADLLSGIAGVAVRRSGAPGSPSFLSLRGASSEGVLILLDGERVNRAQGGGVDLSQIALSGIARGEVLRGGASVLYGANAVGGVVNLSRYPAVLLGESRAALEFGSLGMMAASAVHARRFASGWARILLRGAQSDGDFLYEDRSRGTSELRLNAGTNSRLADLLFEGRSSIGVVRASLRASRSHGGSPGVLEFPTPGARSDDTGLGGHFELRRGAARAALALSTSDRRYRDAASPFGAVDARHKTRAASVRLDRRFGARRGATDIGVEMRGEELDSTTDGARTRETAALFATFARAIPRRITVSAGARADALGDFRRVVSSRGGVVWDAAPFAARASLGTSFRPPSFDDLFWPATGLAIGNPDLRPERGDDWNLGVDWNAGARAANAPRLRVSLDLFEQRLRDLIQWNAGPGGVWRPTNVSRADVRGAEIALAFGEPVARAPYGIEANATIVSARDRSGDPNTDGYHLPGRPRRLAALRAWRALSSRMVLESSWRAVGAIPRTAANTKRIDAYTTGNVALVARPRADVSLRGEIENVTAARYEDYHGFPLPGRLYRVSLEWSRAPEVTP